MSLRHSLSTALAAGALLALTGCGASSGSSGSSDSSAAPASSASPDSSPSAASFDSAHELYEHLREEIGCEASDPEDNGSAAEGELADGSPAMELAAGYCTVGADEAMVGAFVVEGGEAIEVAELVAAEGVEGYGVHAANWAVMTDRAEDEDLAVAEAVQELLGGELIAFSEDGVEKV
jgi:hypothetical protein